jgi:protein-disulfide isomerase
VLPLARFFVGPRPAIVYNSSYAWTDSHSFTALNAQGSSKKSAAKPFSIPLRAAGNKNAAVVVEVFTDFECPHCRELYINTLEPMMKDYCATGKIYFIHREFPLPAHKFSPDATRWVLAAATIGQNEKLTEALFVNQPVWVRTGDIESVAASVLSASDIAKIKQVLAAHRDEIDAEIQQDVALGRQINLDQTPTTLIRRNGTVASQTAGQIPYARLKLALDQLLSK